MKKYSSYFNKKYFPEPEEGLEEEGSLGSESLVNDDSPFGSSDLSDAEVPSIASIAQETKVPPVPVSVPEVSMADEFAAVRPQVKPEPPAKTEPSPRASLQTSSLAQRESGDSGEVETTVISKSAIINGELSVSGDIHMYGKMKGNMTATGNLQVAGKVIGNISGNDVELNTCEIKGDVVASGFVFMDKESAVVGNLNSQDITLDGKVKGDVVATHKVYVRSNALIIGNVRAATIAIDEGAALQGQVSITTKPEGDNLNISDEAEGS